MVCLPTTTPEQVAQFLQDFQSCFNSGTHEELEGAKCRLIWALVHSTSRTHVQRGVDMVNAALDSDHRTADQDRELRYFGAVGLFNLGHYLEARRAVATLMREYPDFRQAETLKSEVDERVVKDGLIGVGVLGAVAAVGVALLLGGGRRG